MPDGSRKARLRHHGYSVGAALQPGGASLELGGDRFQRRVPSACGWLPWVTSPWIHRHGTGWRARWVQWPTGQGEILARLDVALYAVATEVLLDGHRGVMGGDPRYGAGLGAWLPAPWSGIS